jgi:EPS-associated MarR family transcriptional regulator
MRLIEQSPRVSQRELADQLGVSLGGINYCLKALIEKGYVKVNNFTGNPHKLGYMYLLTPSGLVAKASLTRQFLQRQLAEYEALRAEIESLQETNSASGQAIHPQERQS